MTPPPTVKGITIAREARLTAPRAREDAGATGVRAVVAPSFFRLREKSHCVSLPRQERVTVLN